MLLLLFTYYLQEDKLQLHLNSHTQTTRTQ